MILRFTKTDYQQSEVEKYRKEKYFAKQVILVDYNNGRFTTPCRITSYHTGKTFSCVISISYQNTCLLSGGGCATSEENYEHWAIQEALNKSGIRLSCSLPDSSIMMGDVEREVLKAIAVSLNLENYDILTVLP